MSATKRFFGTRRGAWSTPRSQFKGKHQTRRLRAVRAAKAGRASRGATVSLAEGEKAARGSDRIETHQGSSLALEHRMAAVRPRSDVPHFTRGEAERHVAERRSHPLMERLTRGLTNPSSRSRPVEPDAARYPACTCFQSSFAGSRYVASSVTLERRGTLGIFEKTVGSTQLPSGRGCRNGCGALLYKPVGEAPLPSGRLVWRPGVQVGSYSSVPRAFASSPTERSDLVTTEIVIGSCVPGEHIRGVYRRV